MSEKAHYNRQERWNFQIPNTINSRSREMADTQTHKGSKKKTTAGIYDLPSKEESFKWMHTVCYPTYLPALMSFIHVDLTVYSQTVCIHLKDSSFDGRSYMPAVVFFSLPLWVCVSAIARDLELMVFGICHVHLSCRWEWAFSYMWWAHLLPYVLWRHL